MINPRDQSLMLKVKFHLAGIVKVILTQFRRQQHKHLKEHFTLGVVVVEVMILVYFLWFYSMEKA